MKNQSNDNRFWVILFVLIVLTIGIFSFFFFYAGEVSTSSSDSRKEDKKEEVKQQVDQVQKKTELQFSEYKNIYQKYELEHSIHSTKDEGKTAGLEFIFLWRNDSGKLEPFPLHGFRMVKVDNSGKRGHEIVHWRGEEKGTVRFMITVGNGKYVGSFNDNVKLGKTYILQELRKKGETDRIKQPGYSKYWYPIKIPEKEKLIYTDSLEELKETAYRIPILVNEVIKTDYREGLKKKVNIQTQKKHGQCP